MKNLCYCLGVLVLVLMACDKNEEIDAEEPRAESVLKGTGSFIYNAYQPLVDKPLQVFYHIPESVDENSPILMVFHGGSRDAEDSRDELIAKADQHRVMIIVPEFSQSNFPGSDQYNLGNVFVDGDRPSPQSLNEEAIWTFSYPEPLFDYVKELTVNASNEYQTLGFSAGAQFLHRFLLFKPSARVSRAVVAAAGWYTMPDPNIDFPYGIGSSPVNSTELSNFYNRQMNVIVGDNDDDPNAPSLRRNQEADQQGDNREDRAKYFVDKSRSFAGNANYNFNWTYKVVPNTSHDFQRLADYAMDNYFSN